MTVLYTYGGFITLTPAQFAGYATIQYAPNDPLSAVTLGFLSAGSVSFATKLGSRPAEIDGSIGSDTITTGSGHDTLWGNAGNDSLIGGLGNDALYGDWGDLSRLGNDLLYGGAGADILVGGLGDDKLYGGDGNDLLGAYETIGSGDLFYGGTGSDTLFLSDGFGLGLTGMTIQKLTLDSAASVEFFVLDARDFDWISGTSGNDALNLSGTYAQHYDGATYSDGVFFDLLTGRDSFTGGLGAEYVTIEDGNDVINLGGGDDELQVYDGLLKGVTYVGGLGYDFLRLGAVGDTSASYQIQTLTLSKTAGFEALICDGTLSGTALADVWDLSGLADDGNFVTNFDLMGGNDKFTGGVAADGIRGGDGNDLLYGAAGGDVVLGDLGKDSLYGGDGDDVLDGGTGNDLVYGGLGNDALFADASQIGIKGIAQLYGDAGDDLLVGGVGADQLYGGDGNDLFGFGQAVWDNDSLFGGTGSDMLYLSDGFNLGLTSFSFNRLVLGTTNSIEYLAVDMAVAGGLTGTSGNDTFTLTTAYVGRAFHDGATFSPGLSFDVLGGRDTFSGGVTNETLWAVDGNDVIDMGGGDDDVHIFDGNLTGSTILGGSGNDLLRIGDQGSPTLDFSVQKLTLSVAAGFENLVIVGSLNGSSAADVWDLSGLGESYDSRGYAFDLREGNDKFTGSVSSDDAAGGLGNDSLYGLAGADRLSGGLGNDLIYGGIDNDILYGGGGVDALYGDVGNDDLVFQSWATGSHFYGGTGYDTVTLGVENSTGPATLVLFSTLGLSASSGIEALNVNRSIQLTTTASAETVDWTTMPLMQLDNALALLAGNDVFKGSSTADKVDGGDGNDSRFGGAGDDTLIGGAGNDSLVGGEGDDLYVIDSLGDIVVETGTSTRDIIMVPFATWVISGTIEGVMASGSGGLFATGSARDDILMGGDGNDRLEGYGGNDTLADGAGTDRLIGGLGNDAYIMTGTAAEITENAGEGSDFVQALGAFFSLGANIEGLSHDGPSAFEGRGNELDNFMVGGGGNDTLNGYAGNDSLYGSDGDDLLYGNQGLDELYGGIGNDTLIADLQTTVLNGGEGDDTYVTAGRLLLIGEGLRGGLDTVLFSGESVTLPDYVETLVYTGSGDVSETGNRQDNRISGGAGNDHLFGDAGSDTLYGLGGDDTLDSGYFSGNGDWLIGGAGNDAYYIYSQRERITELAGEGNDTLWLIVSESITMPDNVENVYCRRDFWCEVYGNDLANGIYGGDSSSDTLYGGGGNDTLGYWDNRDVLIGGTGDDTYRVGFWGNFGIVSFASYLSCFVEAANEGIDTVIVDRGVFALSANFENLTSTSYDAVNLTGNDLNNIVSGNLYNDTIYGGAGNDTVSGGAGNDSLYGDIGNDLINGGVGLDTIYSGDGEDQAFGDDGNDLIYGGIGFDTIYAGDGNDTVYGDRGLDKIYLGTGDDLFVDDPQNDALGGDSVLAEAGNDTLQGSGGNDSLSGGDGNDRITGGAGVDVLTGGAGSDSFIFGLPLAPATESDSITDFNAAGVNLPGDHDVMVFQGLRVGVFAYRGALGFTGGSDNSEARYVNGVLSVDVNGDGLTDITIRLVNPGTLTAADFVWT